MRKSCMNMRAMLTGCVLLVDTIALLDEELRAGRKVLFEGAQASMLDIDYGTYPYVTASHPVSGGIGVGAGVAEEAGQGLWRSQGLLHTCRRRTVPDRAAQ